VTDYCWVHEQYRYSEYYYSQTVLGCTIQGMRLAFFTHLYLQVCLCTGIVYRGVLTGMRISVILTVLLMTVGCAVRSVSITPPVVTW